MEPNKDVVEKEQPTKKEPTFLETIEGIRSSIEGLNDRVKTEFAGDYSKLDPIQLGRLMDGIIIIQSGVKNIVESVNGLGSEIDSVINNINNPNGDGCKFWEISWSTNNPPAILPLGNCPDPTVKAEVLGFSAGRNVIKLVCYTNDIDLYIKAVKETFADTSSLDVYDPNNEEHDSRNLNTFWRSLVVVNPRIENDLDEEGLDRLSQLRDIYSEKE